MNAFKRWYSRCFLYEYCEGCPDPVCMAEVHAFKRWGWAGWILWRLGFGRRERSHYEGR